MKNCRKLFVFQLLLNLKHCNKNPLFFVTPNKVFCNCNNNPQYIYFFKNQKMVVIKSKNIAKFLRYKRSIISLRSDGGPVWVSRRPCLPRVPKIFSRV